MRQLSTLALCFALFSVSLRADDFAKERLDNWHQWRGPLANGTAPHGNPPVKWDDKTNIKWKTAAARTRQLDAHRLGRSGVRADGHRHRPRSRSPPTSPNTIRASRRRPRRRQPITSSSSSASTARPAGSAGSNRRRAGAARGPSSTHTYAAYSPTTDGRYPLRLVRFARHLLLRFRRQAPVEATDLAALETRLGWGEAVTPVVHGDALIVNWDQEGRLVLVCPRYTHRPDALEGRAR